MNKGKISASMMCASLDKIFYYLTEFKENKIEFLHIDIMDGEFVPNLALGTDFVKSLRRITDIPFDYHFLVKNALEKMKWYDIKENDQVAFHYESNDNVLDCLKYLDSIKAKKFIAINPETDFMLLNPYLDLIDGILVMMVNPGFAGKKMVPTTMKKVENLNKYLKEKNKNNIEIEVDGNITLENAAKLYKLGASIFVSGSSFLFSNTNESIEKLIKEQRKVIGYEDI